jgi:hypothetical protein
MGGSVDDPDDLVLRRIPAVWVVSAADGTPCATSQAFENDRDGGPMSAFLDSALRENGLHRTDIIQGHPGFYAVALTVDTLTREEQTVVRDPIEPPQHICDPAHVLVVGQKGLGRRRRLAKAARWVEGVCPPGSVNPLG